MKKRILALILSACIALTVVGCGDDSIKNDEITIVQYKGLEVDKVDMPEVTDEMVEQSIRSTIIATSLVDVKDRAVEDGDLVVIDYVGTMDGEQFQGGSSEGYQLEIGSDSFIDGFEDQIIGHKAGEKFDITVTFPENYQSTELAGKEAVFAITLHSIHTIPELTDELVATKLSETAKTVKEFKAQEKENLEKSNQETVDGTLAQYAYQALMEKVVVNKYPQDELDKIMKDIEEEYGEAAAAEGMDVETYIETAFNTSLEDYAKAYIKEKMAIEAIAKKEKLSIKDDKEYQTELKKFAEKYGYKTADLEAQNGKESMTYMLLREKVVYWLGQNSVQVESTSAE